MAQRFLLALLVFIGARTAFAFQNEPNGFGKAKLGMTVEDVKKVFPNMKQLGNPTPETAALLAVFALENQSVYGLKPCTVSLQFDPQRLYEVMFQCGNDVKVPDTLKKRFGEPTQAAPNAVFWIGKTTTVSFNPKSRSFAFFDRSLNEAFQGRLSKYVIEHQAGRPGQANQSGPTPQQTPQ